MHIVLNISAIILVNYINLDNISMCITLIIISILILIPIRKIILKDR